MDSENRMTKKDRSQFPQSGARLADTRWLWCPVDSLNHQWRMAGIGGYGITGCLLIARFTIGSCWLPENFAVPWDRAAAAFFLFVAQEPSELYLHRLLFYEKR